MKLLFLRGQVPWDRDPKQIMFDNLDKQDDMWVQLASHLVRDGDEGEVWYEKGDRVARYRDNFVERWLSRYSESTPDFGDPDVVFARGGFSFMRIESQRHKNAFKIHYGAGERVVPKPGQGWDLVLVDTFEQKAKAESRGYRTELLIKPASDNIFKPLGGPGQKKFDIIFCANHNPNTNKGHRFLLPELKKYSVIQAGIKRPGWARKWKNVKFTGWVPRKRLPELYSQAKVAIVWAPGKDSCPRVIPEALACGVPVLVGQSTKFWHEKYITPETGLLTDKPKLQGRLKQLLQQWPDMDPHAYYQEHLSLKVAADHIRNLIGV